MSCDDTRKALSDGGPFPDDHLRSCADCRAWAAALERLPERLSAWAAPAVPEGFEGRVLGRLEGRPLWRKFAAGLLIFAAGAAAGIGARALARPAALPADPAALGGAAEVAELTSGESK